MLFAEPGRVKNELLSAECLVFSREIDWFLQAGDAYGQVVKLRYFFVFDSHGISHGSDEKYFVKILLGIKKSIPIDFLRPLARL